MANNDRNAVITMYVFELPCDDSANEDILFWVMIIDEIHISNAKVNFIFNKKKWHSFCILLNTDGVHNLKPLQILSGAYVFHLTVEARQLWIRGFIPYLICRNTAGKIKKNV